MRKAHKDLFVYGLYECLDVANPHTHVFTKRSTTNSDSHVALVALNFTDEERAFEIPSELESLGMEVVLGNIPRSNKGPLAPFESRIYLSSAAAAAATSA